MTPELAYLGVDVEDVLSCDHCLAAQTQAWMYRTRACAFGAALKTPVGSDPSQLAIHRPSSITHEIREAKRRLDAFDAIVAIAVPYLS